MRESSIESGFQRKASSHGWLTYKLDSGRISRGWPDRLVCLPGGITLFIEFKSPTGKVTPLQAHIHDKLRALGHIVHVCRAASEAESICLALIHN